MLRYVPFTLIFAGGVLFANPQEPNVRSGVVDFSKQEHLLEIRASNGSVIHWNDFSIDPHEVTRFIQPDAASRVLNRVTGPLQSSLLGSLEANGQVYLINQNGVLIGKEARIQTAGLFITTFEIGDDLFANGEWLLKGSSHGAIVNHGFVQAKDGDVYFIAEKVSNFGEILAPNGAVELAAGSEVLVRPQGAERIAIRPSLSRGIENEGVIKALEIELKSAVNPYELAIRQDGEVKAFILEERGGVVFLSTEGQISVDGSISGRDIDLWGDSVVIGAKGTIDASRPDGGGSIGVGGKQSRYVRVDEGAVLAADALDQGSGGRIILWGDQVCASDGSIFARGGARGGDGGFVEISSNGLLMPRGVVDTTAIVGNGGQLLLDPTTVTISGGADAGLNFVAAPPPPVPGVHYTNYPGAAANINNVSLQNFLATNNVLIDTASSAGGAGDINVTVGVSWASNFNLFLTANQDINVNALISCSSGGGATLNATRDIVVTGGGAPGNVSGISLTSGAISATAGRNLLLNGGTGANAPAILNSKNGAVTVAATTGNCILTSGTASLCFAEIASIAGPTTVTTVGGDLRLLATGGGSQAYAQIGKGSTSTGLSIQSNISINGIFGNILLQGGPAGAVGAYAQIGHSPFGSGSSSVFSNISMPSSQIRGSVTLNGGGGTQTTAIIGHGNELSSILQTVQGTIDLEAFNTIALNGGNGNFSHACIGFCNPNTGSSFSATSSNLTVKTLVGGNIVLTAGTGSNAIIGYYNNTAGGFGSVTINSLLVSTLPTHFVTLQAGSTGGIGEGTAAIGTLIANGTSQSNIKISAGELNVLGPSVGDGSARIVNNLPNTSAPFDIDIEVFGIGNVQFIGGTGSSNPTAFADAYSSRKLTLNYNTDLTVNDTLQLGYAQIVANGDLIANQPLAGNNVSIVGGSVATATALMQSLNGAVQLGSLSLAGATNLTVGDPASIATSQILSASGSAVVNLLNTITINGGTGAFNPFSQIGQLNGTQLISSGSDLTLNGGSGVNAFAQIAAISGTLTLDVLGKVTLQGGNAAKAYAQIGKGSVLSIGGDTSVNSDIVFSALGGDLYILAGMAVDTYAQIGHAPFDGVMSVDVTSNIQFPFSGTGGIANLFGGSAANTTAIIGHGNENSPLLRTVTSNMNIIIDSALTMTAGSAIPSHSIIGFHNPTAGSSQTFTVNSTKVHVETLSGAIALNATVQNNANIGYYNALTPPSVNVTIDSLEVFADSNQPITLTAGNGMATPTGIAAIGTQVDPASGVAQSGINVIGGVVTLLGAGAGLDGSARIVNNVVGTSANFDVTINTVSLRLLGGLGLFDAFTYADVYSSRNLEIDFTNLLDVNNDMALQNGYAQIVAYNDLSINPSGGGTTMSLTGGNAFSSYALVQSLNGFVQVGTGGGPGTVDLFVGKSISQSYSKIIASSDFNQINASNNIALQGGSAPNTVAFIQDTSGPITVIAGNNLSLTGGTGGDFASAEITNVSGSITASSGGSTTLLGGGNVRCFARITTDTDAITFTNIGVDLILQGGPAPGSESYAQIGKGYDPAITLVDSNISFTSIGGDVSLTGGTGDLCYAQIGHSPYGGVDAISVNGIVSLPSIAGSVTLDGGMGSSKTTAIIGHGNENTPLISTMNANNITVIAGGTNGIVLTPDHGGSLTHTTIGFHSPFSMTMFGLTATSALVDVETDSPITLNGGNQLNAVIGYYNATTAPPVSVTINKIQVVTPFVDDPTNTLSLLAGNDNGSGAGVAAIGTFATPPSIAQSNIVVNAGRISIVGPTVGANDGSARIINNFPPTAAPFDVSISSQRTAIRGGTASPNGFADIFSSRDLTLNFLLEFDVNLDPVSPATLQHGDATITAIGNIIINPAPSVGILNMVGGNTTAVQTFIQSNTGNLTIGMFPNVRGLQDMNIGRSDMIGSVHITTLVGNISGAATGNMNLNGGAGLGALAEINAHKSLQFNTTGSINLTSGAGMGALTQLISNAGNVDLFATNGVTLTGTAATSPAQIKNLGGSNGQIQVNTLADITLNAESLVQNSGNGSTILGANNNINLNGNAIAQNTGTGPLTTFSGVSTFLNDTGLIKTTSGALTVVVDNNFPTSPGIGPGRFVLGATATLETGGPLRIFTAIRSQNLILGFINGTPFIPGIEFVDTNTEQWGVYYPSTFGGFPFTIFYKDFINVPIPIVKHLIASSEYFQDLHTYDELLFNPIGIWLCYSIENVVPDQFYDQLRRYYRNYNTKLIDPLK